MWPVWRILGQSSPYKLVNKVDLSAKSRF